MYREELNLFKILQTMHKIKACVQVMMNDDNDQLLRVKSLYFKHANIH